MHDDGVNGILDLMGDARGETPNGSQAPRKLDLDLDATDRFGIAHCKQRSDALSPLGNEIECDLDAAAVVQFDLTLRNRLMESKRIQHDKAQFGGVAENVFHWVAQDLPTRTPDEALG